MADPVCARTVWVSDTHLGTTECQAERLLAFLRTVECERLYLVGDVVDLWAMRRLWHWSGAHGEVLREVFRIAGRGTRVVYVPGNHDESARAFCGHSFGCVSVEREFEHRTLDGRRLLVTHGDAYDGLLESTGAGEMLAWGAAALSVAGRVVNRVGRGFGWGHTSLVDRVIRLYGGLVDNHHRFQASAVGDARERGYDGVVCGHIHHPRAMDVGGVAYYNCGDWTEHCTALVEDAGGEIRLVWG